MKPRAPDDVLDDAGYPGLTSVGSGLLVRTDDLREKEVAEVTELRESGRALRQKRREQVEALTRKTEHWLEKYDAPPRPAPRALPSTLEAWLSGRAPDTRRAYKDDLRHFAKYLGAVDEEEALAMYFGMTGPEANTYVLDYRNEMTQKGAAPATINRRLSALRSLAKVGRLTGRVQWAIDVDGVRGQSYRETEGPGVDALKATIKATAEQTHAVRNKSILEFLFATGLRRKELAGIELDDLDLAGARVRIKGKGRSETEWVALSTPAMNALARWLEERGDEPGSLFGLTGGGIYKAVRSAGKKAGIGIRTHGIRHTAVTRVLDKNGGDVRAAASFARHKSMDVTTRYDDNRRKLAKQQSELLTDLEEDA